MPCEAATTTSAEASTASSLVSSSESTCTRSSRRERMVGAAPEGTNTVASQSSSVGSRRSARRKSRSAARSSWSQNAIRIGPSWAGRGSGVAPGRSTRVVRREDPLHQLARGLERGAARVEAAEEQLDEAPRHLGGEHALGGRVERADVERARVAQRDRRRARRERLVDVDELDRRGGQRLLDRARDVQRRRRDRAAAGAGQRQQLADAEHPHAAVGVEQLAAADAPA